MGLRVFAFDERRQPIDSLSRRFEIRMHVERGFECGERFATAAEFAALGTSVAVVGEAPGRYAIVAEAEIKGEVIEHMVILEVHES